MRTVLTSLAGGLLVGFVLAGCATQSRWTGPGSTDEFMKVRYQCYQETVAPYARGGYNRYGGGATSEYVPPCSALAACVAAKGYYRSETGHIVVPASAAIKCNR